VEETCQDGVCAGTPRDCDDGVACNGVSVCLEEEAACSASVNQCEGNTLCDLGTDSCSATCSGCIIAGSCFPEGAGQAGNPCQVCDPARSTTAFSAPVGKPCGAAAASCSGQDTCGADGQCQPNHSPEGTACGSSASGACDQADTCNGRGSCLPRTTPNGEACDDGKFCTVGDACQGGVCVPTGARNCGAALTCNESAGQCQCQGCRVAGNCFAAGVSNGSDVCQICDPSRSTTAFSANVGAACGAGPTECSAQDTCDARGQCAPNDLPSSTACASVPDGQCQGDGRCGARVPPLSGLGASCGTGAECGTGFCANNVCCRESCADACERCGTNGACRGLGNSCPALSAGAYGQRLESDFDASGRTDLMIVTRGGSFEYLATANGQFQTDVYVRADLPLGSVDYTPGDFNGDRRTDLTIVTAAGSFLYLATGEGQFQTDVYVRGDLPLGSVDYTPGDFNGDRITDLMIATASGSYLYLGTTDGQFRPDVYVRGDLPLGSVQYTPGDFNGDGTTDLMIVTASGSYSYLGTTDGQFRSDVYVRPDLPLGSVQYY